ncbi:MAG: ABC transporter permease [Gemmatimonadaceae bacterium]
MLSELWSDIRYRFRALFHRGAMERELDQELAFHLEREAAKLEAAGAAPDEAYRRARVAFGGVERFKEESRAGRGTRFADAAQQDVRYALRALRRNPTFSIAVLVTLALGIGANAAIFGVVDRLLLRPPAHLRDPSAVQRVYLTWSERNGIETTEPVMEYTRFRDLSKWTTSFEQTAMVHDGHLAIGTGDDAREQSVGIVSASFFPLFDVRPELGRFFLAEEDSVPRGAPVVVLSDAFWRTHYGARRDVIGSVLQVGSLSCTIVGVAPPGFRGLDSFEAPAVWIPATAYASSVPWQADPTDFYTRYHWGWLNMVVRRKPGVSLAAATADISSAYRRSWDAQVALGDGDAPSNVAKPRVQLASVIFERGPRQSTVAKVSIWIGGVSIAVLLIACANVANLLLARTVQRRREIALRLTVGVSRGRLALQLLTESLVLAAVGLVAGLLLARAVVASLMAAFVPGSPPPPILDARTLVFAAIISTLAGALTALAPIIHSGRADLATALKSGERGGTARRSRLRFSLLIVQATLSVVLLVGAGLFVRSLQQVRSLRLGFDAEPVLVVAPIMRGLALPDSARANLARQLEAAAKGIPGVVSASRALTVPFWNVRSTALFVTGIDSVRRLGRFGLQGGTADYFTTMGTRILRGRGLNESDRTSGARVVIVSEAMAARLWPNKEAIGQCMRVEADTMPCSTVVGVAENIHTLSITDDPGYDYYLSVDQFHPEDAGLMVRVRGKASDVAETVRRELQRSMPGTSYVTVSPLSDVIDDQVKSWRAGAWMFVAFGTLALILAAVGLYGVLAYDVAQRSREVGVRMALGARPGHVVRVVARDGARFAVIGIVLGGLLARAAGPWIAPLLFKVSPSDPVVYALVVVVLGVVAALASAVPAMRALRVDPNTTLRAE